MVVLSAAAAQAAQAAAASSLLLDTSQTQYFLEPEGGAKSGGVYGYDDVGTGIVDRNYWNFCQAGAATVLLQYAGTPATWAPTAMYGWFTEPSYTPWYHQTTFWYGSSNDWRFGYKTYARAYIMYIAEVTQPQNPQSPNFVNYINGKWVNEPGIMDFTTAYPTTGSTLPTVRDGLNWEMSDENGYSNWQNYFWASVKGATASGLHNDVVWDLTNAHVPVLVALDARDLLYHSSTGYGNWGSIPGNPVTPHAVSIVGYNDTGNPLTSTYYYVDTCGAHCSWGSMNGGVHTLTQTQMITAIHDLNGGGYIW